jgi:hypothetical protein
LTTLPFNPNGTESLSVSNLSDFAARANSLTSSALNNALVQKTLEQLATKEVKGVVSGPVESSPIPTRQRAAGRAHQLNASFATTLYLVTKQSTLMLGLFALAF